MATACKPKQGASSRATTGEKHPDTAVLRRAGQEQEGPTLVDGPLIIAIGVNRF